MNSAIERLLTLRASDVMSRNVICVAASETMAHAAALFTEHKIGGAPVVDDLGQCVGVLSSTDFLCSKKPREPVLPASVVESPTVSEQGPQRLPADDAREDLVRHHMSPAAQTTAKDAALLDAARIMCGAHIHRLLVLGDDGRPMGIVSSLDVIAAMVKAIEE